MRENDQLDLLIDAALATYSEPPAGLEERLLQKLAAERGTSAATQHRAPLPRRWLPWAIALPVAASVLLALFIELRGPRDATKAQSPSTSRQSLPSSSHAQPDATIALTPSITRTQKSQNRRSIIHAAAPETQMAALPKLDVFPTPQPITSQERALVVYAARASAPQIQALITAQRQPEAPLNISAIQIPPLEPPDQGNK